MEYISELFRDLLKSKFIFWSVLETHAQEYLT